MLKHSFIHIPGIGAASEKKIWESGIRCWKDFYTRGDIRNKLKKSALIHHFLDESSQEMKKNNAAYFEKLLPSKESWRLFPAFREETAYLDIETTGLDRHQSEITTIALYNGRKISWYVKGINLGEFKREIKKYSVIVTYNGKSFDIPFIERELGIPVPHAQIDLRYVLGSLGLKGGLKKIEAKMGIDRGDLKDVDGYFAVLLWNEYKTFHNGRALDTLLAYNIADVINLETLMVKAYNRLIGETPFAKEIELPPNQPPRRPFTVDKELIEKLRRTYPACS